MSYVRFVPGFLRHPKLARCSAKAVVLWVAGVDYCVISASDGFLPGAVVASLCPQVKPKAAPRFVSELVAAGLLDRCVGGYRIHDYLKYNPSKAQVEAEQQAARVRYRRWKEANILNAVATPSTTTPTGLSGLSGQSKNPPTAPQGASGRDDVLSTPNGDEPELEAAEALGGAAAEQPEVPDELRDALTLLEFLNLRTGRTYAATLATLHLIDARLREGWSVQDCKTMVMRKVNDWRGDARMATYLRPATLFNRVKLEGYMGELGFTRS